MSNLKIPLDTPKVECLEMFLGVGPQDLGAFLEKLNSLESLPLLPSNLEELLKESVGKDLEFELSRLIRMLLQLSSLLRESNIETADLILGIESGLESLPTSRKWTKDKKEAWGQIRTTFAAILESPAIRMTAKALELSYDYAQLWKTGKILTDIRPLFNDDASILEGSMVSFSLRCHYTNSQGNHSISYAMDLADIKELHKECERALTKAETASKFMEASGKPSIITGDEY